MNLKKVLEFNAVDDSGAAGFKVKKEELRDLTASEEIASKEESGLKIGHILGKVALHQDKPAQKSVQSVQKEVRKREEEVVRSDDPRYFG